MIVVHINLTDRNRTRTIESEFEYFLSLGMCVLCGRYQVDDHIFGLFVQG